MIVIVDEELRRMETCIMEMEFSGFKLKPFRDVDTAWDFLNSSPQDVELMVLDVMMPPGRLLASVDTEKGLRTGVLFYQRVKEALPDVPILILTNSPEQYVADTFADERLCWFLRKEDFEPYQLVEKIREVLALTRRTEGDSA